jgi:hypothetical protein
MMNNRPEKPEKPENEWVPASRQETKEILLWLCAFTLLFFVIVYGVIYLIDNTGITLNQPIPLIGGDG